MTTTELKKRAIALAEKTKIDSVTPEEVGHLSNDIVEYIENVEINGSSLGIRKTYTSVSAMEADSTAPKDDKGVLLRRGMLVNIYNQEEPDSADNGKVFSFQNPGWAFRGTVDAGYATKEELTELENQVFYNKGEESFNLVRGGIAYLSEVPTNFIGRVHIFTYRDTSFNILSPFTGVLKGESYTVIDKQLSGELRMQLQDQEAYNGIITTICESSDNNNTLVNIAKFISDNKDNISTIPSKVSLNDITKIGKNIANPENVQEGYWTTSGVAANPEYVDAAVNVSDLKGKNVTISTSGNSIRVIGCELEDGSYTQEFNAVTPTPYTYIIPNNAKILHVSYNKDYDIQVELGDTATEYEPFERILKGIKVELEKEQVTEDNLDEYIKNKINNAIVSELDYGTNLIDYRTEQTGKYFDLSVGVSDNPSFSCVNTHDISELAGKKVTVSANVSSTVRNIGYIDRLGAIKGISEPFKDYNVPYTFTLPNDTIKELYISYHKVLDNPKNIQLELGESNTPYVDYVEPVSILPKNLKVVPSEGTVGVDELNEELKEAIGGGFSFCPNYLYGKKINYIGDSMVAGHTLASNKIYPTLIGNRNAMTVRNYGYNGRYMTSKMLNGSVKGVVDAYLDMDDDADYIVVWALTNDAREVDTGEIQMGEEESIDTSTVYGALNALCPGLQRKYPKGKILFINIYTRNNSCPQIQDAVRKVCAKYAIPVFNVAEESGISWKVQEQTSTLTLNDTYHLSEQGHEYFSYALEQRLRML